MPRNEGEAGTRALARELAHDVAKQHPRYFAGRRTAIRELASRFGLTVETSSGQSARAILEITDAGPERHLWQDRASSTGVVRLRGDLAEGTERFAIAHELGHFLLHSNMGDFAMTLTQDLAEVFANEFAAQVLVPEANRDALRASFAATVSPRALTSIARTAGLSPSALLTFASQNQWFKELPIIWLDIRYMLNVHTHRDARLRVHACYSDRSRWFIPRNRSMEGLFGETAWLASAVAGNPVLSSVRVTLADRTGPSGKFANVTHLASAECLRLAGSRQASGPHLLLSLHLNPGGPSDSGGR